jgi:hypothetical protein
VRCRRATTPAGDRVALCLLWAFFSPEPWDARMPLNDTLLRVI